MRDKSPNSAPFLDKASTGFSLLLRLTAKHIPEPQGLITSPRDYRVAGRTHAEVEDTICVAGQRRDLCHRGIFPDIDGVLRVPMRRNELRSQCAESEITHLTAGIVTSDQIRIDRQWRSWRFRE